MEDIRDILAVCALGFVLCVLLVGSGVLKFPQSAASPLQIQQPTPSQIEDERKRRYLEDKIGECVSRGGLPQLHHLSGYLGCNLPVKR
jgi:hypothetical protein